MDGTARTAPSSPRRAELLAALSMAIDLGLGQPMEHMLRAALLSTRLADRLGLGAEDRATVYYVSLVSWIGCHVDSHEYAAIFGDDIAARAAHYEVEWTGLRYLRLLLQQVGSNRPAPERAWLLTTLLTRSRGDLLALARSHCASARLLAEEVGLPQDVGRTLAHTFERWDGKGVPDGVRGEEMALGMRVAQLADIAEVWLRTKGWEACAEMVRSRRGTQFDPAVADAFLTEPTGWREVTEVTTCGRPPWRRTPTEAGCSSARSWTAWSPPSATSPTSSARSPWGTPAASPHWRHGRARASGWPTPDHDRRYRGRARRGQI